MDKKTETRCEPFRTTLFGLALLCVAASSETSATAQRSEIVRIDGETYEMNSNPLETWLEEHPGKRPESDSYLTNLSRGYVGSWSITDGRLFLSDVEIVQSSTRGEPWESESRSVMSDLFPDDSLVFAQWYTGYLIVITGKRVEYVQRSYASTYASYIVFTVDEGTVIEQQDLNEKGFRNFRTQQFSAFRNTEEYKSSFAAAKARGDDSDQEIDESLANFYSDRYLSMLFPGAREP